MPPLGTAPHRVSPGVWQTRTGRTLTAAGGAYWENLFRTGHTDGRGHMRTPSVVQTPPAPSTSSQPKAQQYKPPKKPGLDVFAKAKKGDATARTQVGNWLTHKHAEREGIASAQHAQDVGLFGAANPAIHSAYTVASPFAMGALNMLPNVAEAIHGQGVHPLGIGLDVAGLLPFGRGIRAGKAVADAVEAAGAAEGAAKGVPAVEKVLGATKAARETYAEQAALRSEELARRAQKAGQASELAGGGREGVRAALGELKGALPSLRFDALTHLTEPEVKQLLDVVENHPDLQGYDHFFDRLNTKIALLHGAEGKVLTPSEQAHIERAFGAESVQALAKAPTLGANALRVGGELLNIPRSILSSFDVSGVLRQGLVASIHHPVLAAKQIGPMFHMLFSEKYFEQVMRGIEERPNFHLYEPAGLAQTELGSMSHREEAVMSNLAEKIPLLGRVVRGSGRGYTGFLNSIRADIFDTFLDGAVAAGRPNTPELRRQIARQVNVWTGRGGLGKHGEKIAVPLNTVFFSPRLFASRVQTFTTPFYKDLDPYVRKQAAFAATKLVASGSAVLLLAAMAGAKVGLDPRSSDFGKIRVGNTRFDIWGGHQQIAKLIAQVASGAVISSTTGKVMRLGSGFGQLSRPEIAWRFVRGKFSPGTALIYDWFSGTDYQGKPFSWKKEVLKNSYPLIIQDVIDVQRQNPFLAAGAFGVGAFGVGVQSYGPKKPKPPAVKVTRSKSNGGKNYLAPDASAPVSSAPASGRNLLSP